MTAIKRRDTMKTHTTEAPQVVGMTPQFELIHLRQQLKDQEAAYVKLERDMERERNRALTLERDLETARADAAEAQSKLQSVLLDRDRNWTHKVSKEERQALREQTMAERQERLTTGKKKDGRSIPTAADEFQSYDEMQRFLEVVRSTGRLGVRNWAMVRVGICFGLRISDLIKLKWCWLKNPDGSWREYTNVVEQKTMKLNRLLITDAVKETLSEYIEHCGCDMNGYVFPKTTGGQMTSKHGSQILVDMNKIAGIPRHISSHSMRKTFANIILSCYDGSMEVEALDKVRVALNHVSLSATSHYTNTLQREVDNARKTVSDFVLGKSEVKTLGIPKQKSNNDLFEALEALRADVQQLKTN